MRVAIYNWTDRLAGGAEGYLGHLLPLLEASGVELSLAHELEVPSERSSILPRPNTPRFQLDPARLSGGLEDLRQWRPDVVFSHGPRTPAVVRGLLGIAPVVQFIHNHVGCCISGTRAHSFPRPSPCTKHFGWGCFLHFLPRRCGGWNPWVAWRLFRQERAHWANFLRCSRVITHSRHMKEQLIKQGLPAERVALLPFMIPPPQGAPLKRLPRKGALRRLLFMGRMDVLKGGGALLEALPIAQAQLGRRLELRFAGAGPARLTWEEQARRLGAGAASAIDVTFLGWVVGERRQALLADSDLLVMPSLWPEPFGQSGLEAGFHGVPTAAFRVGGISDWLRDGTNGHLAAGDPPTPSGLAKAIVRCLEVKDHWETLSGGARSVSREYAPEQHVRQLLPLLVEAGRTAGQLRSK